LTLIIVPILFYFATRLKMKIALFVAQRKETKAQ